MEEELEDRGRMAPERKRPSDMPLEVRSLVGWLGLNDTMDTEFKCCISLERKSPGVGSFLPPPSISCSLFRLYELYKREALILEREARHCELVATNSGLRERLARIREALVHNIRKLEARERLARMRQIKEQIMCGPSMGHSFTPASRGEQIWCRWNGVWYHYVVTDLDHAAKTVTLLESREVYFTYTSQVKLSFREFFELGFKVGGRRARTRWYHNQLYKLDSMHSLPSYNWQYFGRKSNTLRHIKNRKSYDNCNRPIGTKRPSHQSQSETIHTHKEGNKSGYESSSNSESHESREMPNRTLKTSSETLCLQSPVSKFNVNIQQLKVPPYTVLPSRAVLLAMFVAAAMLPYIALLVGNLTSVQRTYTGLWRPNKLCDY